MDMTTKGGPRGGASTRVGARFEEGAEREDAARSLDEREGDVA